MAQGPLREIADLLQGVRQGGLHRTTQVRGRGYGLEQEQVPLLFVQFAGAVLADGFGGEARGALALQAAFQPCKTLRDALNRSV